MREMLSARHLKVSFGSLCILDDVSFSLEAGTWMMLVGPNGAGKSTIVNVISGGLPYEGDVFYEGRDIRGYRPQELARQMGVLAQTHSLEYSFTVSEVVRLGRYSHAKGVFRASDPERDDLVEKALEMTGMTKYADHSVLELSGGEQQRMFLAQLFAQNPRLLILDEPTNHLDLIYQKQTFELITDWLAKGDRAVISVVHDLSLAKAYGTDALLLNRGKTISQGPIQEVFSRSNLLDTFNIDVYAWMGEMLGQWSEGSR